MKLILLFGITVFIIACNQRGGSPDNLMNETKMTDVLWDYMKADAYALEFIKKYDSTRNDTIENIRLQSAIFNQHKVTPSQFFESYRYYCTHPEKMRVILDSIEARQSREKRNLELNFNKDRI